MKPQTAKRIKLVKERYSVLRAAGKKSEESWEIIAKEFDRSVGTIRLMLYDSQYPDRFGVLRKSLT
jgi:hypothetical protein